MKKIAERTNILLTRMIMAWICLGIALIVLIFIRNNQREVAIVLIAIVILLALGVYYTYMYITIPKELITYNEETNELNISLNRRQRVKINVQDLDDVDGSFSKNTGSSYGFGTLNIYLKDERIFRLKYVEDLKIVIDTLKHLIYLSSQEKENTEQ